MTKRTISKRRVDAAWRGIEEYLHPPQSETDEAFTATVARHDSVKRLALLAALLIQTAKRIESNQPELLALLKSHLRAVLQAEVDAETEFTKPLPEAN